jgi:hypothetical protein
MNDASMNGHRLSAIALLFCSTVFVLSACKKTPVVTQEAATSSSAIPPLPSAPLGLYVSTYLGGGTTVAVTTPLTGVTAQQKLHTPYDPMKSTDTFSLLQQLGNTLQVNISDLLNRSTDRPGTLNTYFEALQNITERGKRTLADLNTHLETVQKDQKSQSAIVSDLQKRRDQANHSSDYATAGGLQQSLTEAQAILAQEEADAKATKDTVQSFQTLLTLADKRIAAITSNREILISGLKVIDVPGTENLNIIQANSSKGSRF